MGSGASPAFMLILGLAVGFLLGATFDYWASIGMKIW